MSKAITTPFILVHLIIIDLVLIKTKFLFVTNSLVLIKTCEVSVPTLHDDGLRKILYFVGALCRTLALLSFLSLFHYLPLVDFFDDFF